MNRREFLTTSSAVLASSAFAGMRPARAQQARRPDPAKLDRIAIMALAFQRQLKLPDQPAADTRTLELFDLPEMLADVYGVHNVEYQASYLASTEPTYLRDLRASLDRAKSRMTNINLEFGPVNVSALDQVDRDDAFKLTTQWIDRAVTLGCPRVMINQGDLNETTKAWAIPGLRAMNDYARGKGVKLSVETRLFFPNVLRDPPAPVPRPAPPPVPAAGPGAAGLADGRMGGPPAPRPVVTTPPTWVLLTEVIRNAGVYSNVDFGNVAAQDQGELHAALRALLPMTVGNVHARVSQLWDLATVLRFMTTSLKYEGLFSIEAYGQPAVTNIYNIILDTI